MIRRHYLYLFVCLVVLLSLILNPLGKASAQDNMLVDIVVTIGRIYELESSDTDVGPLEARSDYYPIITINEMSPESDNFEEMNRDAWRSFETEAIADDYTIVDWQVWLTQPYVDVVPISIELWDRDNGFGDLAGDDDQVDISPNDGRALDISVSLTDCVITGEVQGICGTEIESIGNDPGCTDLIIVEVDCDGNARLYFTITINNPSIFNCGRSTVSFDYKPLDAIENQLQAFATFYPAISSIVTLNPSTEEGRSIVAIKISDNAAQTEDEPRVLFVGTHHAREWISSEIPLHLADYLLANYRSCTEVRNLIDNSEIWIVPVTNPDGYVFSGTSDRDWRKNRSDNGDLGVNCRMEANRNGTGVDPNRNYDTPRWSAIDNDYFSSYCASETFKGPFPFSESEPQSIRNLMNLYSFDAALSYHSYAQRLLHPFGYTSDPIADERVVEMANLMVDTLNSIAGAGQYQRGQSGTFYRGNNQIGGTFDDWVYTTFNIPVFTIELPPRSSSEGGFELPPDRIRPTWEANRPAALCLIEYVVQEGVPASCSGISSRTNIGQFAAAAPSAEWVSVVAPRNREVRPGDNLVLEFSIENRGTVVETYDLVVGRGDEGEWVDVTNIPTQVTIDPGSTIVLQVPIIVPPAEENPVETFASVEAISQSNPDVRDFAATTLRIRPAEYYVTIEPAPTTSPETERRFTIAYGNSGRATAVNVAVGVEIPPEVTFISDSRGGSEVLFGNIRVWYIGDIPSNTTGSFDIVIARPSLDANTTSYPIIGTGIISGLNQTGYTTLTSDSYYSNNRDEVSSNAIYTADSSQRERGNGFVPNLLKWGLIEGQNTSTPRIRWIITASNQGAEAGINVVITDDVPQGLRIDRVDTSRGEVDVNGQQVRLRLDRLEVGETFTFSIFTTQLDPSIEPQNTVSLTADNLDGTLTARGRAVSTLPGTGETPWWRHWLFALIGVVAAAIGVLVLSSLHYGLKRCLT